MTNEAKSNQRGGGSLRRLAASGLVVAAMVMPMHAAFATDATGTSVMPKPRSLTAGQGVLTVTPASGVSTFTVGYAHLGAPGAATADARLVDATNRMLTRLDRTCGGVRRAQSLPMSGAAKFTIDVAKAGDAIQSVDEDESYQLTITADSAKLTAATDLGAMHGLETLLQLARVEGNACVLPAVTIDDAPRFPWRGFMLDVSRHFEPVDVIKRSLDGMAVAKLNVFHWHLSDDQGFRAESKIYPKLTSVASNGEFYTQEQMRDVVAYAHARGIRVVPEFDIPGHSTSWVLAYPEIGSGEHITGLATTFGVPQAELDPSRESTYKFIDAFIGEMGAIFPDAYFHIGGDETSGKGWLDNPSIAAFMKKKGFAKTEDLQAYFNQRLLPILTKHHKKMIGWDEILNPALPKSIVIQSWRGEASLADGAKQGYTGILSAPYYLDGQKTSEQMFLADPIPADTTLTADQQKLIIGGETAMWAEQLHPETVDSRVWPRTLAIAERFWSPQDDRDVADMYRRLRINSLLLEDVGLTHISGPEKLRRNIAGELHPEALDLFANVLEPVSFGERYEGQKTDSYTSLNRLVDAVVADPPSRQQIAREVDAVVAMKKSAGAGTMTHSLASIALYERFAAWQKAVPALDVMIASNPRLSDTAPRAEQLGMLAEAGIEALAYLHNGVAPPAGWKDAKLAEIAEAKKPVALVRFTFLPSLQKLIEAAAGE